MLNNLLDYIRIALFATIGVTLFFLYQAWIKEHPTSGLPEIPQTTESIPTGHAPSVQTAATTTTAQATAKPIEAPSTPSPATGQLIHVKTDVLEAVIDTLGGDIVEVKLLDYPESLGSKQPYLLLNNDPKSRYIAESGLLSQRGPDTPQGQALYTADKMEYTLAQNSPNLEVQLRWQKNGIEVSKIFTFLPKSYEIKVFYDLKNHTNQTWNGNLYNQLLRTDTPPENHGGLVNLTTYFGAAISTKDKQFEKITFKDMKDKSVNIETPNGWAAMVQHYFVGAWIPAKETVSTYYSRVAPDGLYTIGRMSQPMSVQPGGILTASSTLYAGPAMADLLEKAAPGLKLTIDYGWFWMISDLIFWMMQKIYDVIGNWGWSIVMVTIIIKLLFYKLSDKSYRSMSMLKRLQPKIEQLKQRFGDDKQKLTQATLDLYRSEKVNPMSGCLPILIQIPVFIALYWVLVESVQLRQAPFIFWIHDLSQADPYYILPVLMGASMFLQQRLNPPPPDPMQAKVMMLMPFVFTFLFANFPAGLMLYWFVNNTLSFAQQWYIMHKIEKESYARAS